MRSAPYFLSSGLFGSGAVMTEPVKTNVIFGGAFLVFGSMRIFSIVTLLGAAGAVRHLEVDVHDRPLGLRDGRRPSRAALRGLAGFEAELLQSLVNLGRVDVDGDDDLVRLLALRRAPTGDEFDG